MSPTAAASSSKIAVIGGTSLFSSAIFADLTPTTVKTEHGSVLTYVNKSVSNPLVFVQRHHADATAGADVYFPPHRLNHRAIFAALRQLEVQYIIAVCSVGSVDHDLRPGNLIVPDDYFNLFGPPICFHDDGRGHIVPGFDPELRKCIIGALEEASVTELAATTATYIQATGPRFETRAEIRYLSSAKIGHLIGMTGAAEATMAKEIGIPYAIIAMIDNMANGMDAVTLTTEEFTANVAQHQPIVENAIRVILDAVRKKL